MEDLNLLINGERTNKYGASSSSSSSDPTSHPTSMSLDVGVGVWIWNGPWVGANVVSSSQGGWEGDGTSFLLILVCLVCLLGGTPTAES